MRFFYRTGNKPAGGLHLWYNVHTECEHLGVSLTGLKVWPVSGKAKPQNVPVLLDFMVYSVDLPAAVCIRFG